MDDETRTYFESIRREIGGLRDEVRGEIGALRDEMGGLHDEMRRELATTSAEDRRHFGVIAEALRQDIQTVAEGVLVANQAIDRLRVDLRRELDDHFETVRLSFEDVRRSIADLDSRG
jgi:hypothetical protein